MNPSLPKAFPGSAGARLVCSRDASRNAGCFGTWKNRATATMLALALQGVGPAHADPIPLTHEASALSAGARCDVQPTALDMAVLKGGQATGDDPGIFSSSFETQSARIILHVLEGSQSEGAVSDAQVAAQLRVLNEAFAAASMQFEIAQIRRYPDSPYFRQCYPTIAQGMEMKRQLAIRPAEYINVYSCELIYPYIAGYATFPNAYAESDPLHGVNVDYRTLPGGTWAPYNLGATLVHEIGHYLGLFHTFQGGCDGSGDLVDDTPAEASAAAGCPVARDSCPAPGVDPVTNFMNYSDDACMDGFTPGQGRRMSILTDAHRPSLFDG